MQLQVLLYAFLVAPWMIPAIPDEINIDAFLVIATVTAVCRTTNPIVSNSREKSPLSDTFPLTKITPDLVEGLAGRK